MIQFQCDYNEGAHPRILERLMETNFCQTVGYGMDEYCDHARALIKEACKSPDADVHFLVGGTQTNATVISSILRPYQGVVCAETGHINVHETGAIEHSGHKCLAIPAQGGKISAKQILQTFANYYAEGDQEHMVQPAMVYISFSTEVGSIYTKQELTDIYAACRKYDAPLFIDGARLGYGLASPECDLTLPEFASLCDVFYIGGTKVGALFGEAVVITNPALKKDFRHFIKMNGGMLAKGRLLGIQFETLFTHNLYFEVAKHANNLAMKIRNAFKAKGFNFLMDSPTNQQFPILTNNQIEQLKGDFLFSIWQKMDDEHTAVRFCTSWGTKPENVDKLLAAIEKL
ncbi:MAG: low specificity L-threonine aldolase [Bacteroidaceae bacterium]|nr:low specificity L-threonine aldolase [Bacteroidaceae bacterium]